jgi:dCMP deaminase
MSRKSRVQSLMQHAWIEAERSTCLRLQVGAILVRDGRMIASGYNGVPSGFPHCTPEDCGPDNPCVKTVHAELNSILFAARYGIATEGARMYTTDSPCKICSQAIINAGLESVVYAREYRDTEPLELLRRTGKIQIFRVTPFGELIAS